jgi:DNA-binding response OmpR family regulator
MRPKKRVLLIDDDELRISVQRCVLETHGYLVYVASDAKSVSQVHLVAEVGIDLILCQAEIRFYEMSGLIRMLKRRIADVPVVLVSALRNDDPDTMADVFLPAKSTQRELVERIRVLLARKRGPKKPCHSVVGLPSSEATA